MEVNKQITINASAQKLWKIIGTEFNGISRWASRMLESSGKDDLGPMGGRAVTTIEYGPSTETLYEFDDERRELAYAVEGENLPPALQDVKTAWRVEPTGDNEAVVHLTFLANLVMPEMGDMINQQFGQGLEQLFTDLKHYAENDQPHPDKQAQLASG